MPRIFFLAVLLLIEALTASSGGLVGEDSTAMATTLASGDVLSRDLQENSNTLRLAGILDTTTFDWAETLFSLTVRFLNTPGNGFFDEELKDIDAIEHVVVDAGCDGFRALSSYYEVRDNIHGVVGARCSGASIPLGWIWALDNVPRISMSSSSSKL